MKSSTIFYGFCALNIVLMGALFTFVPRYGGFGSLGASLVMLGFAEYNRRQGD